MHFKKENIEKILTLILSLILGIFFGMGILGTHVTVDLSSEPIVVIFKGSRVLIAIALATIVAQSILNIFKQENRKGELFILILTGLIRIFVVYEISNLFLSGVFGKSVFPSFLVTLFFK